MRWNAWCCKVGLCSLVVLILCGISPSIHAQNLDTQCVARVESIQGRISIQKVGQDHWEPGTQGACLSAGAMVRVEASSRAAVMLHDHTVLRLDQNSTLRLTPPEQPKSLLLELLEGAAHFFSRTPRQLKVVTPFLNASIEGTEFFVRVGSSETFLTIFEGQVLAANSMGEVVLAQGQSSSAGANQAPVIRKVIDSRASVHWTLHYPMVFVPPAEGLYSHSMALLKKNDPAGALALFEQIPAEDRTRLYYLTRGSVLMAGGRAREALADLDGVLAMNSQDAEALALKAILGVVQSRKDEALELARQAVSAQPDSATARLAMSYALQARFDVKGALREVQAGVAAAPDNALVQARLAELYLSIGELNKALEAAEAAASLDPDIARTQTVLGFARLAQIKTGAARQAFDSAIELDPADPLPRLGLGLAIIRDGDVAKGREQIELAAALNPGNALIRSYLGKAYFEEKRDKHASGQLTLAKELDPQDPTPWFYDAIRKQSINQPVAALHDLQKSIELNDNRAVYRSQLLLDGDLAARSASLGRIFRDLGFEQMALVEGWKSVNTDPSNYSAHRFLADSYSALPRHDIARVSELLQSQLLQPLNITPIQPSLSESNRFTLESAGPAEPAFNEFNPLFMRNRLTILANGLAAGNGTWGDELVFSGLWGRSSWSLGQSHYETDGFRANNDLTEDIYNVYAETSLNYKTKLLAEFRYSDREEGDLPLRFPQGSEEFVALDRHKQIEAQSMRLGFRHAFSPSSDVIAHVTYLDSEDELDQIFETANSTLGADVESEGYMAEGQYLWRGSRISLVSGIGHLDSDQKENIDFSLIDPPVSLFQSFEEPNTLHTNFYAYSHIRYPKNFTWVLGASGDLFDDDFVERDQFNPKLGMVWTPRSGTALRAAGFRTLKRSLKSNQTIEPTQVAGFNQFYDDPNGTDTWRYGIGIDQALSPALYCGAEYSQRDLDVFYLNALAGGILEKTQWDEQLARVYLNWTFEPWLALSADYLFERFEREPELTGEEQILELDTHRVPLEAGFFHKSGFRARIRGTWVQQDGEVGNETDGFFPGKETFWVVDASLGYLLSKRLGRITVGVNNLFDETFNFQDTHQTSREIYPEQNFFAKVTLAF